MVPITIQINPYFLWAGTAVIVVLALFLYFFYRMKRSTKALQAQVSRLENEVHARQLTDIDYKLNPHLFKNVLNAIQSHAYQTYNTLDSLSNVLDYILYESKKKYVTPHQEIAFALSLVEINKIKLSPLFDLKIKQQVEDNEPLLHQRLMAPLLCTDLIENAFKHADLQSPNSFISITLSLKNNVFTITVANKVSKKEPIKKDKQGYGGKMLEQRLNIIYKENYKLDKFIEGDVFIAHLKIDLLEHKAKMLVAR